MSQYPVDDQNGYFEAINYLLSGPGGNGQNFDGFSSYAPTYIRPSFREPWSLPVVVENPTTGFPQAQTLQTAWYLNIPISNAVPIGPQPGQLFKLTFTTPFTDPPFQYGDRLDVSGVVDTTPGTETYNGSGYTVFESTVNDVTLFTSGSYNWATYVSGGFVGRDYSNFTQSTDCNAKIFVNSGTDQVFVTAQIKLDYDYTASMASEYDIIVQINRYTGSITNSTPTSPTDLIVYDYQDTINQQVFHKSVTTSGSDSIEAVFTTTLDGPSLNLGSYWYILDISFVTKPEVTGTSAGSLLQPGDDYYTSFGAGGTINQSVVSPTTFSGITPTNVYGSGVGAVMDITLTPFVDVIFYTLYGYYTNTEITFTNAGSGYKVGDVLKILGTSLGGTTPTNDLYLIVTQVAYPGDALPGSFTSNLRSLTAQVIKE